MEELEFQKKHPDCDYDINIEEFLGGYPYVRCSFWVDMVLELVIDARTIEECCEIADKVITSMKGKVDYSDTDKYLQRAHNQWDEKQKENKKRIVV